MRISRFFLKKSDFSPRSRFRSRREAECSVAFTLDTESSGRRYSKEDLALAEELARRAAIAVDNALLYAEAKLSIRTREEFISVASHELRTPLTSLGMRLEILPRLLKGGPNEETLKKCETLAAGVRPELDRMVNLVETLLDFSRLRSGRMVLKVEQVDLCQIVRQVIEMTSWCGGCRRNRPCDSRDRARTKIRGNWDPVRIRQVITNLVSNAIKFAEGRPVEIVVTVEGENAVLNSN